MNLIEDLEWRYATKKMDPSISVPQNKIDKILKAISLAPTSMGLEAYKVLVITDKELIARIHSQAASRQAMLTGCSHLLVFASYSKLDLEDVDKYLALICSTRNISIDDLAGFRKMFIDNILSRNEEGKAQWMACQTHIALGFGLIAAANEKVDACPVEGFDDKKLDEILDLASLNLKSTLLMPLGYRATEDYSAKAKKVVKRWMNCLFIFREEERV